jgi:glutamate racemase
VNQPKLSSHSAARRPIGVFDSGVGGLTIVHAIRQLLPRESIVYFGDMARLPYGTKSKEQILSFSIQNTLFLIKHKVKAVVVACNSSSSAAYTFLKRHFNLPIIDVIEPAAQSAVEVSKTGKIGVIATAATIESRAYEKALLHLNGRVRLSTASCPLFVPLVEEGWLLGKTTEEVIRIYLQPLLRRKIDTLILGCTHYPLLRRSLEKVIPNSVQIVDSVVPTVQKLASILEKKGLRYPSPRKGDLRIYVSDKPRNFVTVGEKFLREKLHHVEVVRQR